MLTEMQIRRRETIGETEREMCVQLAGMVVARGVCICVSL